MTNTVEQTLADHAGPSLPAPPGNGLADPSAELDNPRFELPRLPTPWRRPLAALPWIARLLFGLVSLVVLLVAAASTPLLNLLALGYLLEAAGTVARTGNLRRSLPILPAARLGAICLGCGVFLIPVWLVAEAAADAWLIAGNSWPAWRWYALLALTTTLVGVHLILALARGGSLGCFLCPIKNARWLSGRLRSGTYWPQADQAMREFLAGLRLPHHFWLGARGFLGTWACLIVPMLLYWPPTQSAATWQQLVLLVGGAGLVVVLAWLPWLQTRLAAENRWRAMFEAGRVRELFRHAPLSWLLATAALYASSIPLFIYTAHHRMHIPFHVNVWWDVALVSIVCTFPARLFVGWVYHRATIRGRAWIGFAWIGRLLLACLLIVYVWLLFHIPIAHEARHAWLIEHHGLVLPIPW